MRCGESFSNKVEPVLGLSNCVINAGPVWGSNMEGGHCVIELCPAIGLNMQVGVEGASKSALDGRLAPTQTAFAHEGTSGKYLIDAKGIY